MSLGIMVNRFQQQISQHNDIINRFFPRNEGTATTTIGVDISQASSLQSMEVFLYLIDTLVY